MSVLVTGSRGLLGTEFMRAGKRRGQHVIGLGRHDLDVTDRLAVERLLSDDPPEWVVHCAAYTAVDRAEEESETALRVNRDGTGHVASSAAACGARMVYVSSDYVFSGDGQAPYRPEDPVAPRSAYARSKLEGEVATREAFASGERQPLVVRTGWLYGSGGRNFVGAIIDRASAGAPLRVVDDQLGRPTWARNVAEDVLDLMALDAGGTWHVADGGEATWVDLAREALRLEGIDAAVEGVSTAAWGAAAHRPRYSVLDLSKTEAVLGRPAMPWQRALRYYLNELAEAGS